MHSRSLDCTRNLLIEIAPACELDHRADVSGHNKSPRVNGGCVRMRHGWVALGRSAAPAAVAEGARVANAHEFGAIHDLEGEST